MTHSTRSSQLFERAQRYIPGGVNSPVRAFKAVGGDPIFFARGEGAYLFDEDGNRYIDYVGSWGPALLGHAHPTVVKVVQERVAKGLGFGAPHALEVELAELICSLIDSIEQVRLVSSGTEACLFALRLARGYTRRDKIIKFEGGYHGGSDAFMSKAGSGLLTLGMPSSAGVPQSVAQDTLTATYNDLDSVANLFSQYGEIAAIFVEPVAGNMGCILPQPGFLSGLRDLCDQYQALLIFDEVMTGFRVALGGAQTRLGVKPDITTLGKVIGGGLPLAAFGGSKAIMQHIAPLGDVYQAGTLSGNPVAVEAGLATLKYLKQQADIYYPQLDALSQQMVQGLTQRAKQAGVGLYAQSMGGMFGFFFTDLSQVTRFDHVKACDSQRFQRFFHHMLNQRVYLAPSPFEAGFISLAHTQSLIDTTLQAAERSLNDVVCV